MIQATMRTGAALSGSLAFLLSMAAGPAFGQEEEETSPEIELGSSRIGGPGLTEREQRARERAAEPDVYLTEENLPAPGSKKRIPSLFVLLKRYHDGQAYQDACEKLDLILEEGGEEALNSDPRGRRIATRAYLECARIAFTRQKFGQTETLLKTSERYGSTTGRHTALRVKVLREQYRKRLSQGDISGTVDLFREAQAKREDEDERIWLGAKLAERAWRAYDTKSEMEMKDLMAHLEEIAPQNTDYRRLKDQLDAEASIFANTLQFAAVGVLFVVLWSLFSRWRARRKVEALAKHDLDDL